MKRDTTRALALILDAQDRLDAANRKLVEAAHVLRDIDARETRPDPSVRKAKRKHA